MFNQRGGKKSVYNVKTKVQVNQLFWLSSVVTKHVREEERLLLEAQKNVRLKINMADVSCHAELGYGQSQVHMPNYGHHVVGLFFFFFGNVALMRFSRDRYNWRNFHFQDRC